MKAVLLKKKKEKENWLSWKIIITDIDTWKKLYLTIYSFKLKTSNIAIVLDVVKP